MSETAGHDDLVQTEKFDFPALTFSVCVCVFVWMRSPSRWWAWTLIKRLTPEEALQVRAKVAALEALKGHRADMGLQRAWAGNYLVSVMDGSCVSAIGIDTDIA